MMRETKIPDGLHVLLISYSNSDAHSEVPYLFKNAGCIVDVLCTKDSWLLKNQQWDNWIESNLSSIAQFVQQVSNLASLNKYAWIIPVEDSILGLLNKTIYSEEVARKILPLTKLENRKFLWSKAWLSRYCEQFGILTPTFDIYEPGLDPKILANKVTYPLVLKTDESNAGQGVFFCNDEISLLSTFNRLTDQQKNNLLFQKYIKGDNIAAEVLYKNGRLLAYTSCKVVTTLGGEFGISVDREYIQRLEIEPILQKMGEDLGINGFGNLTFILSNNQYYLLEADIRPQVWCRLAFLSGVDFSIAIKNFLSNNLTLIRPALSKDDHVTITHFTRKVGLAITKRDYKEVLRWIFNIGGRWKFIPWYDKRLFWEMFRRLAVYLFTESIIWEYLKKLLILTKLREKAIEQN